MKRTLLMAGGLAVLLSCAFGVVTRAGASPPQTQRPQAWPELLGERSRHSSEYGFVYAGKKSHADQARNMLQTVVNDLSQDGVTGPTDGLILVMDAGEKPPFETTVLIEALARAGEHKDGQTSEDVLKSLAEARRELEKVGLEMDVLLSFVPLAIAPSTLPEIAGALPADVDRQIGWCVIVPTNRCVKAGMRKVINATMKKEKTGWAGRMMIGALMPFIEGKAAEEMEKKQQALLYEVVLNAQTDVPEQRKQGMNKAYRQKLSLEDRPEPDDNKTARRG